MPPSTLAKPIPKNGANGTAPEADATELNLFAGFAPFADMWETGMRRWWNLTRHVMGIDRAPVGQTPRDAVWSNGKAVLYRYRSENPTVRPPLLLVMSLVSRSFILDLQPGNSFIERLVAEGFDVFLLDWGVPDEEEANNTLETYCDELLPQAVAKVNQMGGENGVTVFGYCYGGLLSLLYAAGDPDDPVRNLVVMATPVDFAKMPVAMTGQAERAHAALGGIDLGAGRGNGDPHRRMRLLVGLGQHGAGRHAEGAALVAVALVRPHLRDRARVLVPGFLGLIRVGVHAAQLGPGGRASGAELEPAIGEDVEHRGAFGCPNRVVELGDADDDPVPNTNLLGLHRASGEEELRRGAVRVLLEEVVLDGPDRMESHFVGDPHLLQAAVIDLMLDVVLPGSGHGDFVEDAEFHGVHPDWRWFKGDGSGRRRRVRTAGCHRVRGAMATEFWRDQAELLLWAGNSRQLCLDLSRFVQISLDVARFGEC